VSRYRVETDDQLSPAEKGEAFVVPRLMAEVQGELQFADTDVFMEYHDWRLADHPALLDESAFSISATAHSFEIDINGRRVTYEYTGAAAQLALDINIEGWTAQNLALWLDRLLRQDDISQSDLLRWLSDCVGHLTSVRKISINGPMRAKFI
jgi:type III restriction enzyme